MTADTMIATILRQVPDSQRTRVAAWRQLSDILAQRGNQLSESDVRDGLHALAVLRPNIPENVRRETAIAIARHGRFAPIVALYAHDAPSVSAAMLQRAHLSEADWIAMLPSTGPVARSILAHRIDLPDRVRRALGSLGNASVALPQPAGQVEVATDAIGAVSRDATELATAAPSTASTDPSVEPISLTDTPEVSPSQISELVRRIDKYQSGRESVSQTRKPGEAFLFETGPDGIIHWVDGVARGAIIGLSISEAALGGEPGTDGVAAGAFRQRAEMINARMILEGNAGDAGEWRFSALPWFDRATGQFRGYRGSARRPQRNEIPYGLPTEQEGGDSIRQLIHELRSPLNAISGFAQIIAGQMFGPVNQSYRGMADTIVDDAAAIQQVIDDLEAATRPQKPASETAEVEVSDLGQIASQVERDLMPLMLEQHVTLSISRVGGPFFVPAGIADARRMVGRLLTALVDVSERGGTLVGQLVAGTEKADAFHLRMVRPNAIRFTSASDLLDPSYSPDGEAPGAAMLSLGFSLRLVDSLARASGGRLDIGHNALTLMLPSANPKLATEAAVRRNGDDPVSG